MNTSKEYLKTDIISLETLDVVAPYDFAEHQEEARRIEQAEKENRQEEQEI